LWKALECQCSLAEVSRNAYQNTFFVDAGFVVSRVFDSKFTEFNVCFYTEEEEKEGGRLGKLPGVLVGKKGALSVNTVRVAVRLRHPRASVNEGVHVRVFCPQGCRKDEDRDAANGEESPRKGG